MSECQPPPSFVPCSPDSQFQPYSVVWNGIDKEGAGMGPGAEKSQEARSSISEISPSAIWRRLCNFFLLQSPALWGDSGSRRCKHFIPKSGGPQTGEGNLGTGVRTRGSLRRCCPAADGLTQIAFHPSSCFLVLISDPERIIWHSACPPILAVAVLLSSGVFKQLARCQKPGPLAHLGGAPGKHVT